jgi:adenylyltransferase/sulfurtransferase
LSCAEAGVLGVLPSLIGSIQATETIKVITEIGETLSGKLLLLDALTMHFITVQVTRQDHWKEFAPATPEDFRKTDYAFFCGSRQAGRSITAGELSALLAGPQRTVLLDVREPGEEPRVPELNAIGIPLGELERLADQVPRDKEVVVFCRSGARSRKAIALLENNHGFTNLRNLEGGIMQWLSATGALPS